MTESKASAGLDCPNALIVNGSKHVCDGARDHEGPCGNEWITWTGSTAQWRPQP